MQAPHLFNATVLLRVTSQSGLAHRCTRPSRRQWTKMLTTIPMILMMFGWTTTTHRRRCAPRYRRLGHRQHRRHRRRHHLRSYRRRRCPHRCPLPSQQHQQNFTIVNKVKSCEFTLIGIELILIRRTVIGVHTGTRNPTCHQLGPDHECG